MMPRSLHFASEAPSSAQPNHDCDHIAGYRLLEELGEGGCGTVYLVEQTAPIKREVALKVIKLGMDTKAVIARFEAERQALALMDHPHIAKVFDAGATASGRPYFVMEVVRGIKITTYCDQCRSSIAERLALFIQVCQAIQHAHSKGIIHRDIKPSNVLVTLHDGAPVAKVIDFGIAKATHGRLTEHTLHTVLDHFIGTPAYVSPEQAIFSSAEADTRSDIYSLGVLLYELLTGRTPVDAEELLRAGLERLRQRIWYEEPPRPSLRLKGLDRIEQSKVATSRSQNTAPRLIKQLRGDLDWIALRCLEKEPARRYQTAHDLILDIQRHLHHEPISAGPHSIPYQLAKFTRRHRLLVAAGAATAFFTIAFAVTASIQAQRIKVERDRAAQESERAETVSEFMLRMFEASQPETSLGRVITAREVLDEAGRRIRGDLNQHPDVRARLLEAIGRAYRLQSLNDRAVTYLQDALRVRKQMPNTDGTNTAAVLTELALALRAKGDLRGADSALQEALELTRQHRSERSITYARLLASLGRVELSAGGLTQARQHYEESVVLTRALLGPTHPDVAAVLIELSNVFTWLDDPEAAERNAREAVTILATTLPEAHPDRVSAEARLGDVLLYQNRIEDAAPLFEKSLILETQLYGTNSKEVADILDSLAFIRRAQGRLDEAEDFARRALVSQEAARGKDHSGNGYFRTSLAAILNRRGKYSEAEELARQSLAILEKTLPPDHQYVASSEHVLGEALLGLNRLADAEAVLTAAMNRWKRTDAPAWRWARSASTLGEVFHRSGRNEEAERYLTQSYIALATDKRADHEAQAMAQERITRFYRARRELAKLDELMRVASLATTRQAHAAPVGERP
jgi:eukaryotic-like serine/threonine-protein kinase